MPRGFSNEIARSSITFIRNHFRPNCSHTSLKPRINALASARPNDGALYKALEVAVATSDFIVALRRISLASFHSVGSSRTPEEVWIEGHVSVKWPILTYYNHDELPR